MTLLLMRSKERCRFRKFLADLKQSSSSFTLASPYVPTSSCRPHGLWTLLLIVGLAIASTTTSSGLLAAGVQAASARPTTVHSHTNNERYSFEYRPHQPHPSQQRQYQQAAAASSARSSHREQHEQQAAASLAHTSYEPLESSSQTRMHRHTSAEAPLGLDLTSADQLLEPMTLEAPGASNERHNMLRASSVTDDIQRQQPGQYRSQGPNFGAAVDESYHLTSALDSDQANSENEGDNGDHERDRDDEPAADNSHERDVFLNNHKSHLRAMRDMFERRQLSSSQNGGGHTLGQSSQELSPIAIGLDPGSPFSMPPFAVGGHDTGASPPPHHQMSATADGGPASGGGPALPFGLNPLPHLLGFQGGPYDGPQRGDQPAYTNHHAASSPASQDRGSGGAVDPELAAGQKVWPKIFRFTDGRINLSDFEKQKKLRLSSKNQHGENHIESAPIMFDGRQLKRKSFLILHGGVFQGNRR